MDIQSYLENAAKAVRDNSFSNSDQLNLLQLIEKIEAIAAKQQQVIELHKEEAEVVYDFGTAIPTIFDSWRGSYSELALGYKLTGYDDNSAHSAKKTISEFVSELKSTVGKSFTGWKGGEFTMSDSTPVWVANPGNVGSTAIIDVLDCGYQVVLITGYRDY